ncbi:MAG: hypothetical protein OHK0039_47720 [Bacteroidia bacterium]
MAEKRKIILTKLASEQITHIYDALREQGFDDEAAALMDDFLDVVFGEIPVYPERFPPCEGIKPGSGDYRIGNLVGDYRVIFQIVHQHILILLILHESELPF